MFPAQKFSWCRVMVPSGSMSSWSVRWPSSGWTNNRNVTQMLEFLVARGEVAISSRQGRQQMWDVAGRVYPAVTPVVALAQALRVRNERRLRALGIARAQTPVLPGSRQRSATPVSWRWPRESRGSGGWTRPRSGSSSPRVRALLSPFDRLVHDGVRLEELFEYEYEYVLEMYKPKANRRWGYFALPILHGGRLVGKVDATVDRRRGTFTVHAVQEDVPFTLQVSRAVHDELRDLASWLSLTPEGVADG
ncbi:DNA glycosylase AlkZ-like family protein [Micromonospora chalcea]|uniref:DNA glycosylase AlkZ-like family protein n=1 Tax=Micromonospora chalcea TaxID=1874 RepID=UPI003D72674D